MDFKQAWKAIGNSSPGNTSWSADIDGRPVFTAWRHRDFSYDKQARRSSFNSPPGDWIDRGEGQSFLRRARVAMDNDWVCRLVVLNGKAPWAKVASADIDDVLYSVKFLEVRDDGTIRGQLLSRKEFMQIGSGAPPA